MPRPKNKKDLLDQCQHRFELLNAFIAEIPVSEQDFEFPEGMLNRNIRDVLAHLHHWHLLFLNWYKVGMAGEKPEMPAPGYTWKTLPEFNRMVHEIYVDDELSTIQESFTRSFEKVRDIIAGHTDEELFEKKRYKWTGTTSLGAYLISATSSHYDWALKLIKKARKAAMVA